MQKGKNITPMLRFQRRVRYYTDTIPQRVPVKVSATLSPGRRVNCYDRVAEWLTPNAQRATVAPVPRVWLLLQSWHGLAAIPFHSYKTKEITMNHMNHHQKVLYLVHAALIAAIYVVLTELAAGFDLASGAIQVRFSEVLTVLPFFTGAAIPGVTLGCLLANILTGSALPDVIFGTLATLIGAVFTYRLRRHRFLCTLPPVISNGIIIPLVLRFAYGIPSALWFLALTVGVGEVICCVIFGSILISVLLPRRNQIFAETETDVTAADHVHTEKKAVN